MLTNLKQFIILLGQGFILLALSLWLIFFVGLELFYANRFITQPDLFYYSYNFIKRFAAYIFIFVLISVLWQYFQIRKLAQGKQFDLSPIQRRHLKIASSPNVIFEHCVTALNKLQAFIVKEDKAEYFLEAQIRNHNKNHDMINVIRIDIVPTENSHSQIKIICRPFFWVSITDNGYNYQNAEKLLSYLNAEGSQQE